VQAEISSSVVMSRSGIIIFRIGVNSILSSFTDDTMITGMEMMDKRGFVVQNNFIQTKISGSFNIKFSLDKGGRGSFIMKKQNTREIGDDAIATLGTENFTREDSQVVCVGCNGNRR